MMTRLKYRILRGLLILVIVGLLILEMLYLAPRRMSVHFETVQSDKIPQSFENISIAIFSDVYGNVRNLERAVASIDAYQPEVIVFNGNLYGPSVSESNESISKALTSLNAPLGKFAILSESDPEAVRMLFQNAGFTILNNQQTNLYANHNEFVVLAGLTQDFSITNDTSFTLGFANDPALVDTLKDATLDMVVAGKTNLGQINLPFIGSLRFANQHTKRRQQIGKTTLLLSSGVSTTSPEVRLLTRPEVLILRLQSHH